jgi:hypothetical protein
MSGSKTRRDSSRSPVRNAKQRSVEKDIWQDSDDIAVHSIGPTRQAPEAYRQSEPNGQGKYAPCQWVRVDHTQPLVDLGPAKLLSPLDPNCTYHFFPPNLDDDSPEEYAEHEPDVFQRGKLAVKRADPMTLRFLAPHITQLEFASAYSDGLDDAGIFIRECRALESLKVKGPMWLDFSFDVAKCKQVKRVDIDTCALNRDFFRDLVQHLGLNLRSLSITCDMMDARFDLSDCRETLNRLQVHELTLVSRSGKPLADFFARLPSGLAVLNVPRSMLPPGVVAPQDLKINLI